MSLNSNAITEAALSLPDAERATLAGKLLDSLSEMADPDIDAAWAVEAKRRLAEYQSGEHQTIPADEVIQSVRTDAE